jgi:phosphoglycolate phosphatase-like HAD superfamily hydrolase
LLKPEPHLLNVALAALGKPAGKSTLVGDSVSDIEAAHAAGTQSIGYANKPGKASKLLRASADFIIGDMTELSSRAA